MPTESQEIGSDKDQKNIKKFRKEIVSRIANARIEGKYYKRLIKTINSDDLTLFFNSLIKTDSLFWFLHIIHHLYQELFSLYNKKFLVFDELLLENLKYSWQWIEKEREIFNKEHNLITELKNIFKETFPEQYFEIIKHKQSQARVNFNYYFPELKLPENVIIFWKQIIQEENLSEFLSAEWKEKIADLCNNFINFEKNIKKFKIVVEGYQEFILNHKRNLEKIKECSEQVALVSYVMKKQQFLVDLEDYNNENYYNSFQKKLAKSIDDLKKFINNIQDSKIMDYYYQFLNSTEEFDVDSLEWKINRMCSAINNEFTILKKISDSYTKDLTKNFIMKYITEAVNLTKTTSERIKEIELQFGRYYEQLVEEENKSIEVINKKIEVLENVNKTEKMTYENLSKTLENISLDNDKKMIEDLKQQIEKIRNIIKEKILESKKNEEKAIEEEKQKTLQLQEIIDNTNLMKDNIKNYHQKIIEFIKFFTISLYEFILWFKNNEWDREKYKLNNIIGNFLQPGLIIKIEYKNDNLQYKLPWSNFIYLKTENNNYLVLAVNDSEEANFQILNKEGRKILIKKLIEEKKYYFLSKKFCNLYTKFTLIEDNLLNEKEVNKIFKKIESVVNIETIENETPQLTNNKQKEFYQAALNKIFQKIEEEYQVLITSLQEIFSIERSEVINSWTNIDNNERIEIKNEDSSLFEMIIKYIDTYMENVIPKIKEETEDWDAVEEITIAFKSEFEKKDAEIEHLRKIIVEKEKQITQLKNMVPKKYGTIVSFSDIKEQCDLDFLPILRSDCDALEQSKESDSSRNLSSTSLASY